MRKEQECLRDDDDDDDDDDEEEEEEGKIYATHENVFCVRQVDVDVDVVVWLMYVVCVNSGMWIQW